MGRVQEKVAFITGAARGQGRSHAVRLAQQGADIVAVDVCSQIEGVPYPLAAPNDLRETARLVEAEGRRVVAVEADVRDLLALQHAVSKGVEEFGSLDIVVANAGIVSFALVAEMDESTWQTVIDVNLSGVWRTLKATIPALNDGSSVIITGSVAGMQGSSHISHYASAKQGLLGLMRALAMELGPRRIRVNLLAPAQVETDIITNQATYDLFCPDVEHPDYEDFKSASQQGMVLPTPWAEPLDVSNLVLFLASDESRYITGATIPIDAGNLLK
jgi:(+)-trans-carveol dehydrogenase